MRILVLGGTSFLGRAIVEAGTQAGHELTLFNRGKTNPGLYPHVEQIHGDRATDLDRLAGRSWDVVIDTSGYYPDHVGQSARLLADRVERYIFVSTMLVYRDMHLPGLTEEMALAELGEDRPTPITNENIGALKAACERAAEAAMPGRVLTARPGPIMGPNQPGHLGQYWPTRMARGGEVLAPGRPDYPVQWIDVRDLAQWLLSMAEARATGAYNTISPPGWLTLGAALEAAREAAGSQARLTWVPEAFLLEQGVAPYRDLPLWYGEARASWMQLSSAKAVAAGLTFRPPAQTMRDIWAWLQSPNLPELRWTGLSAAKEADVLAQWHAHS